MKEVEQDNAQPDDDTAEEDDGTVADDDGAATGMMERWQLTTVPSLPSARRIPTVTTTTRAPKISALLKNLSKHPN